MAKKPNSNPVQAAISKDVSDAEEILDSSKTAAKPKKPKAPQKPKPKAPAAASKPANAKPKTHPAKPKPAPAAKTDPAPTTIKKPVPAKETQAKDTPSKETPKPELPDDSDRHDPDLNEPDLHEVDEEHHVSIAARSLQILAILAIGAIIGIWAAPKIAPLLPRGMGPVAQWLSPANNAEKEDLEQLKSTLNAQLSELASQLQTLPDRTEIETRLANFQTDTVNPVRAQMTALSDQVAAADSTAVESRLWALEGRVEGLIAEINGLTSALGDVAAEGGTISADTAASISAYRTRIDGLQASLDEMASQQGALSQKIDQVAATAQRQVSEAETMVAEANIEAAQNVSMTELQSAIGEITAALQSGADFSAPLARLTANTDQPVPAALLGAQDGVQTLEDLQAVFVPAAHNAIRAALAADSNTGIAGTLGGFLRAQVATRSLTPQSGDGTDAILSRLEAALLRDDLEQALSESQSLPDSAMAEMAGWLVLLEARQDVKSGLITLRNALGLKE